MRAKLRQAARQAFRAFAGIGDHVMVSIYDGSAGYDATTGEVFDAKRQITPASGGIKGTYQTSEIDGTRVRPEDFPLYVQAHELNGYTPKAKDTVQIDDESYTVVLAQDYAKTLFVLQCGSVR